MRGESGRIVEKVRLRDVVRVALGDLFDVDPPMSLNSTTGFFARPSQVTETKYSCAIGDFSSTSTERARWPETRIGRIASKCAAAWSGVSANFTAPAFMRPPESTWLFSTTGRRSPRPPRAPRPRSWHPALRERQAALREQRLRFVFVETHGGDS
jgi:hypothetical protein